MAAVIVPPAIEAATPSRAGRRAQLARWCERSGALPIFERLRRLRGAELRILAYHRIVDLHQRANFSFDLEVISANSKDFEQQARLLQRRYHPLRLVDVVNLLDAGNPLPKGAVVITFDDGYDDNFHVAFPILRRLGIPATFFVSTGHIDDGLPYAYDWLVHLLLQTDATQLQLPQLGIDQPIPAHSTERRLLAETLLSQIKTLPADAQETLIEQLGQQWGIPRDQPHADCQPMTWNQLREMHAAGMEIGSHGRYHRMLAKLPAAQLRAELEDSKATLDRELNTTAVTLSYPVGGRTAYNAEVLRACETAGFRLGCTYRPGTNPWPPDSMFELRRLAVERYMDQAWFAAMLAAPELFACRPHKLTEA